MAFEDKDLVFLQNCSDEELDGLFYVLTHDRDGNDLNNIIELKKSNDYKQHFPKHSLYVQDIAKEIGYYASSSKLSKASYKDLLYFVCDKLTINYNAKSSIQSVETNFLMQAFSKILARLSFEDIKALNEALIELKLKEENSLVDNFEAMFFSPTKSFFIKTLISDSFLKVLINRQIIFSSNEAINKIKLLLQAPINWLLINEWSNKYYKDDFGNLLNDAFKVSQLSIIFYLAYLRQNQQIQALQNSKEDIILID